MYVRGGGGLRIYLNNVQLYDNIHHRLRANLIITLEISVKINKRKRCRLEVEPSVPQNTENNSSCDKNFRF